MASRNEILTDVENELRRVRPPGWQRSVEIVAAMRRPVPPESAHHKQLMECYYLAREAQALRAEAHALGYATETDEFFAAVEPRVTFKAWLTNQRTNRDDEP